MNASPGFLVTAHVGNPFPVSCSSAPTDSLLKVISEVLDVRDVFPRVAQIASHSLPHDCLTLAVSDECGELAFHVKSAPGFPDGTALDSGELWLVPDLCKDELRNLEGANTPFVRNLGAVGYRSLLCVRTTARDRVVRLGFFSKRAAAYTQHEVPMARRIADVIAVAVSHQQLAGVELARAAARARTERSEDRVRCALSSVEHRGDRVEAVGHSPEWRQALRKAAQVAATDTTVFLRGESGTGKEVVARFIHQASPRKNGPFVPINCAALPEQLLESELFGYERGAFTGAHQSKMGQIETASGGVLFLDEVSEMSPTAQAKLLRFLQEREFQRLGGTRPIKANVRVIAASNRDLRGAVAEGVFREDLYYRLHVFDIPLAPLRDRKSDIPLLAATFLQEFGRTGCPSAGLSIEATEILMRYAWPGNIRQLRNALERAAILCEGGSITPEHLSLDAGELLTAARSTDLPNVERRTIEQVLRESDGNKSKAARRLGITRTQLYCRMRKYRLEAN